jgi:predicted acyl esterase
VELQAARQPVFVRTEAGPGLPAGRGITLRSGRAPRRLLLALTAIGAAIFLAPAAQAEVTSVFTDAIPGSGGPATPVTCEVLDGTGTGQQPSDAGVRFCGSRDTDPTDPGNEPDRTTVKTFDGVSLDVNVAIPPEPEGGEDGNFPVVMMFHGYAGTKIGLSGMRRWLSQGYATFSMTTRGFGESCGSTASRTAAGSSCDAGYVRLMDTRYEVRDAQEFVGELVDEDLVDPNAIGATGASYGGGMSMALAALKDRKMLPNDSLVDWESPDGTPLHIAAAAPEIPWTDLAYSLVPNGSTLDYVSDAPYLSGNGRIGVEKEAWVNTLYLQGLVNGFYAPSGTPGADLTGWRILLDLGGPYDDDPEAQAIIDEIAQRHSSYYIDHSEPPAPSMITNGWTDDLFPAMEAIRFYNRTRTQYPDTPLALNLLDFGHPRSQNKGATVAAMAAAENAWFDYYLKGNGDTPPNQVQAMTQTCPSGAAPGGPYVADAYPELSKGEIRFRSGPRQTISKTGTQYGPEFGNTPANTPPPPPATACTQSDAADNPKTVNYRLDPAPAGGFTLIGSPTVIADFTAPGDNTQVAARLLDVGPDGQQTLVARGLWRPDISTRPDRQVFQLNPNAYHFDEGHIAKLELLPEDAPYGHASPGQKRVDVQDLELRLPVREPAGSLHGLVRETAEKVLPPGYHLANDFAEGPPDTFIRSGPPKRSDRPKAKFTFDSSDVDSTFECSLDGEDFAACDSPLTLTGLKAGSHVFRVRATDADDLTDTSPAKRKFKILH